MGVCEEGRIRIKAERTEWVQILSDTVLVGTLMEVTQKVGRGVSTHFVKKWKQKQNPLKTQKTQNTAALTDY